MNRTDDLANEKNQPAQRPSVSVITPTLNEEKTIVSFIKYLKQSQPYEIIVADGGSSDSTVATPVKLEQKSSKPRAAEPSK